MAKTNRNQAVVLQRSSLSTGSNQSIDLQTILCKEPLFLPQNFHSQVFLLTKRHILGMGESNTDFLALLGGSFLGSNVHEAEQKAGKQSRRQIAG